MVMYVRLVLITQSIGLSEKADKFLNWGSFSTYNVRDLVLDSPSQIFKGGEWIYT